MFSTAFVVMPNHVHVLVQAAQRRHSLADILHSWKSFTSQRLNRIINSEEVAGLEDESFDTNCAGLRTNWCGSRDYIATTIQPKREFARRTNFVDATNVTVLVTA